MENDNKEFWKVVIVNDHETKYLISNKGSVYSLRYKKIMKPEVSAGGYLRVGIHYNKMTLHKLVHRLVAVAFIPNPENKPCVNHKNGDKTNNTVENLEWCDVAYNNKHAYITGLKHGKHGDESHFAKYKKKDVKYACELMESGIYNIHEISSLTGINVNMLGCIQRRQSWTDVSKNYDVENMKTRNNKYTQEQIENVFKLLEENELSIYDISDKTGVKTSTIHNIMIHKYKIYSYLYEIYDISKYTTKCISPLPMNVQKHIRKKLLEGASILDVTSSISKEYNINHDRIHDYVLRIRRKIGPTTTEI